MLVEITVPCIEVAYRCGVHVSMPTPVLWDMLESYIQLCAGFPETDAPFANYMRELISIALMQRAMNG